MDPSHRAIHGNESEEMGCWKNRPGGRSKEEKSADEKQLLNTEITK